MAACTQIGDKLLLKFRKYFRDPSKHMHQGYLREALGRHQEGQQQQQHQRRRRSKAGNNNNNNNNPANDSHDSSSPSPPPSKPAATSSVVVVEEKEEVPAKGQNEAAQQPPPFLRDGVIDSVKEGGGIAEPAVLVAFVSGLFSQEEDIRAIAKLGMAVRVEKTGLIGKLKGPFGKLGKCKVEFAGEEGRLLKAGDRVFVPR